MRQQPPIRTIDDLAFEFGRKALLRRWLAWILDTALLVAAVGGTILAIPSLNETGSRSPIAIGIITFLLYFFVLESRWGITVGKLFVDIRVVDANGNPPGAFKTFLRTVMRVVEANPAILGSMPAAMSIFKSPVSQRIGDRMADTYVLRRKDLKLVLQQDENNDEPIDQAAVVL